MQKAALLTAARHVSQRSLAFAPATVCHCMLETASGAAAGERDDVILPIAGTSAGGFAGRRAGMVPLKFPRHFTVAQEPLLRLQGRSACAGCAAPVTKIGFGGEPTRVNQR